ncbi:MAG: methyltransferase domain-containing protein, partial [Verrucomicrobiota bacterium]
SKITPHFQKPRSGKIGPIGFLHTAKRSQIIDVPECPIASPALNKNLSSIRKDVKKRANSFRKGATLLLRESATGAVLTDAHEICEEQVGNLKFLFPAGDFFQNNPSILSSFVGYVKSQAQTFSSPKLVDAYCGSGFFGLSCASEFESVIGIEVSEGSIAWAKKNAQINQIENASFIKGSAEAIFDHLEENSGSETTVIIDPPRKGCSREFLEQLFEFSPEGVVYISCNPATQMRDLKLFQEANYQLKKVQPFDLFPQTRHLECVITLSKASGSKGA